MTNATCGGYTGVFYAPVKVVLDDVAVVHVNRPRVVEQQARVPRRKVPACSSRWSKVKDTQCKVQEANPRRARYKE